mmetsp:Transcript_33878/g.80506  ORF Transcript_33878/g.80506 Transcript_33878/m.80506 type:complete len:123 (-) Transcript_33878:605-973(-)
MLKKLNSARVRMKARTGTTRSDKSKNAKSYEYMLENIALFACEGGAVEACSPSDLFGALQGIASRRFPDMKLHATLIDGDLGRDVQQEVTELLHPFWDVLGRGPRRTLRRELVASGLHQVLG